MAVAVIARDCQEHAEAKASVGSAVGELTATSESETV
jgi:hypothetical protein